MTALFARNKTNHITSYDLFKTFALITMLIDHTGSFLLIDETIFKAVGRWSFPVWLFLIGFSNTRTIPKRLWVATALVTLSYLVFHRDPLPLNILATIIVARLVLPIFTRDFFYKPLGMMLFFVGGTALMIPTYSYVEYGVTGVMFAFWGHICRQNKGAPWLQDTYAMLLFLIYAGFQTLIYSFSTLEDQIVLFGCAVIMLALHRFKAIEYQRGKNWPIIAPFLRFCGRYTLEIYVVHVILFTIISAYLYGEFDTINLFGFSFEIPVGGFTRK